MKYLEVTPGQTIAINGRQCTIESVLSLYHVLVRDTETGEISKVPIEQIRPQEDASQVTRRDISEFSDKEWERIEARYATIEPLVGRDERTVEEVKAAATEAGVHIATIYRWLEAFERTGDKAALLPQKPSGGRKKGRLDEDVERVLQSVLRDAYLSSQRHTPSYVIQEVRDRCRALNLRAPTETTIRTRMSWIDERERIKAREGSKAARDAYEPRPGKYVAQAPLSVVQIDHTPVNVMVVDEVDRRTLGRPWITVAIDVYSRMVVGFYLSLDRPSALSVGMCIAQGVLPKQSWLTRHGVTGSWPVWGFPAKVHADNAKEFRGKMLAQACKLYHCDLEWRPVGVPNYGGHIESLCGTLSEKFNNLEGTTFSNTRRRGNYKPHKKAVMTLEELETWLTTLIVDVYHNSPHSGLDDLTPLKCFEQGVLGTPDMPGSGMRPLPLDEERIRLDLLPMTKRSIQPRGVRFEGIKYYHDSLRKWINAKDPENPAKKRKFIFRYDPRDISKLYFYDPDIETYLEIPYRDITRPRISLWELKEAKAALRKLSKEAVDEEALFRARERLRQIEADAKSKTKKARLREHRQKRAATPGVHTPKLNEPVAESSDESSAVSGGDSSIPVIDAFEEIE